MLVHEIVEVLGNQRFQQLSDGRSTLPFNLQQQTLLEGAGTDTSRIEALQQTQHLLDLLGCDVDGMVDGQLV